jgi:hypothetical protein
VSAAAGGRRLRPLDGLGRALVIVLGIGMVGDLANILVTFLEMRILERYQQGEAISDAEIVKALDRSGFVGLVILVLFLVSGILWLVWQHRGHANLHAAGVDRLRFTPGWAVGWWFVPFANIVKPFQTVRELWKASDGSPQWWETKTWPVIGWWWAGYLVFNVLDGVASAYFADESVTVDSLITGDKLSIAGDVASVATAILAIWIVRSVTRRQSGLEAVRPEVDGFTPPRPDLPRSTARFGSLDCRPWPSRSTSIMSRGSHGWRSPTRRRPSSATSWA